METLRKIIVVHGPANAGKTAVVNLLAIRLVNEGAYQKIKKSRAADFLSAEHDSMVLYSDYSINKKLRKVALCSKGDSIDDIKDAFEFAEDSRANVLVVACRDDAEKNMPYSFLCCKVRSYVLCSQIVNKALTTGNLNTVSRKAFSKDVIKAVDEIHEILVPPQKTIGG